MYLQIYKSFEGLVPMQTRWRAEDTISTGRYIALRC